MKARRLLEVSGVALAATVAIVLLRRAPVTFATPDECIAAYYDAAANGDAATYSQCFSESIRADTNQLGDFLRITTRSLKGWALIAHPTIEGVHAQAEVDEQHQHLRRRVRFRLVRCSGSWLIAEVGGTETMPTIIPYGTHEKELLPKS